jgi:hypothetical protein
MLPDVACTYTVDGHGGCHEPAAGLDNCGHH